MLERDVEKRFVKGVKALGLTPIKMQRLSLPGYPDRLVPLSNGLVVWVELKAPGGVLSKVQEFRHAELRAINHVVGTFDDPEKAIDFVRGAAAGAARLTAAKVRGKRGP